MAVLANQFSTENNVASTSGTASVALDLGFTASLVRIQNDKATAVYVSLNSTAGSTNGYRTCATESVELRGISSAWVSLASTTTTTGTLVRVGAWGGFGG